MKLMKILPIIFLLILIPAKSFADTPNISAGKTYYNLLKGHYVLKDNVRVELSNHGLKAKITADEARVNLLAQKCWATGKVTFIHDDVVFACDSAYLQWQNRTADVVGSVNFESKDTVKIQSESATFNWREKIADFYGAVQIQPENNLQLAENLQLENTIYEHVKFDVRENKIIQLEKTSDAPKIFIPETDVEVEE